MSDTETVLYRPVGKAEMEKIEISGFRKFPPRLPEQPILYVVLTYEYALQIAKNWNTKDPKSGFTGYVTRFKVRNAYLEKYEVRTVGSYIHKEYWIPAGDIDGLNENIVGEIKVAETFVS